MNGRRISGRFFINYVGVRVQFGINSSIFLEKAIKRKADIMANKKANKKTSLESEVLNVKDIKVNTEDTSDEDGVIIPWQEALGEETYDPNDMMVAMVFNNEDCEEIESYEDKEERYGKAIVSSYPINSGLYVAEIHFDASSHFMKPYVKEHKSPGTTLLYFVAHYDMHSAFWKAPTSNELVLYTIENEAITIKDSATFDVMFPSLSVFEDFCQDKGIVHWTRHYCFEDFTCKFNFCKASYVRISGNMDTTELFTNAVINYESKESAIGFAYHFRNSYYNYLHVAGRYELNTNPWFFGTMTSNNISTNDKFYDKLAEMYLHTQVFEQFLDAIEGGNVTLPKNGGLKFCQMTAQDLALLNPGDSVLDTYHKLAVLQNKENSFRQEHGLDLTEY